MPPVEAKRTNDLTSRPIVRAIWALALPTIAGNLAFTMVVLVDLFWVAKLGGESVAAVGAAGHILFLLFPVFMGLSSAATTMVAHAVGAGDYERADHVAGQTLLLTFICSLAVAAVGLPLAGLFFELLGTEAEVTRLGSGYLMISLACAGPMLWMFIAGGILRGAGDAVTPFVIGLVVVFVNLLLDPMLIFWAGMGVRGAAVASVAAESVGCAIGLTVLARGRLRVRLRLRDFRPDLRVMWRAAAIGLPAAVQMSLRALTGLVILGIITRFGTAVVAAYTVCMRIQRVAFMPAFGLGAAAQALVGQNLGAGKPDRAQRTALAAAGMALLVMGSCAAVFSGVPNAVVGAFTDDPEVVDAACFLLRITAPALAFAAVSIVLGSALRGAGDTVPPMVITIVGLWAIQVPLAYCLVSIPWLGVTGVWWANVAGGAALVTMTSAYFFSGRWKQKKV